MCAAETIVTVCTRIYLFFILSIVLVYLRRTVATCVARHTIDSHTARCKFIVIVHLCVWPQNLYRTEGNIFYLFTYDCSILYNNYSSSSSSVMQLLEQHYSKNVVSDVMHMHISLFSDWLRELIPIEICPGGKKVKVACNLQQYSLNTQKWGRGG